MPMETDTREFAAIESGNWFFHCHILYHMMSGIDCPEKVRHYLGIFLWKEKSSMIMRLSLNA